MIYIRISDIVSHPLHPLVRSERRCFNVRFVFFFVMCVQDVRVCVCVVHVCVTQSVGIFIVPVQRNASQQSQHWLTSGITDLKSNLLNFCMETIAWRRLLRGKERKLHKICMKSKNTNSEAILATRRRLFCSSTDICACLPSFHSPALSVLVRLSTFRQQKRADRTHTEFTIYPILCVRRTRVRTMPRTYVQKGRSLLR